MGDVPAFSRPTSTGTLTGAVVAPPPLKRCAILGTAPSWKQCPWQDQTLECWGLNDGYLLGMPRADRWFDLHPVHQMSFHRRDQRTVSPDKTQPGMYLRPEGHLSWLQTRPFPVYIQQARSDWPTSRTFPKDEILERFKPYWPLRVTKKRIIEPGPDYEVSTPSWMLMLAIMEGYTEIHVYGIHLATSWEYQVQRPNFEWLLGLAAGLGTKIVLPASAPICKANYRYAFEPKADIPHQIAQQRIEAIKADGLRLRQQHAALPWHAFQVKKDIEARLAALEIDLLDARQQSQHLQAAQHIGL